jgi:hypothetical protein
MTTTRWLRISAVLSFLFAAGHTLGGRKLWSPMGDNPVLDAMKSTHFNIRGVDRSYLDFYLGFGYSITVFQLMLAVLLWQLATIANTNPGAVRPMVAVIALATALSGVITYKLILPLPALFSLFLLGTLSVAYALARRGKANPGPQTQA